MAAAAILERARTEGWSDEAVVERVRAGETALFEIIMRRYNQRLYRVARGILRNDAEAEDVMQDAYVRAYQYLYQFEGRAKFSTWLTRIAVHEALARSQRQARYSEIDSMADHNGDSLPFLASRAPSPEHDASAAELRGLLEKAIAGLPDNYRTVLMLRDVEEMSTSETADCLSISEENVKVRLHRARAILRRELYGRTGAASASAFRFEAPRCDRVVRHVMARLRAPQQASLRVN